MVELDKDSLQFLCKSLSNATGMPVRIFRGEERIAYHSIYQLLPDPGQGDLARIVGIPEQAGVIVSELMQFYGFFYLPGGEQMIIGPSRAQSDNQRRLREQVIILGVSQDQLAEYLRCMGCLPVYSMERMSWLISFLNTVSQRQKTPVESLFLNQKPEDHRETVHRVYADGENSQTHMTSDEILLDNGYRLEQMLLSYIEQGKPERVRELLDAPPSLLSGQLSHDTLQQAKNLCICVATVASRAAIAGGLDSRTAFRMSDLYIQQVDFMRDTASARKLHNEIYVDFAREVQRVRYHVDPEKIGEKNNLFLQCAEYVSQNIFSPIRAQEIADSLGYTRSYLCSRFRELSGMTLTQYIQQEKVFEAQRLLRFTDQSLSQLAILLAFSSQAHFQTVFKKMTDETPAQYRNRMR